MSDTIQCERCGTCVARSHPAKRFCSERCRKMAETARREARKVRPPRKQRQPKTIRDRRCKDCATSDGMDWWVGRHVRDDGGRAPTAAARCQPCYNAMIAKRYQRRTGALPRKPNGTRGHSAIVAFHRRRDAFNNKLTTRECLDCHSVFYPLMERRQSERCTWCTDTHNAKMRSESMALRLAAVRSGDDGINWRTTGERDGWACHLCGDEVLPVAGTAHEPRGATVDHITPIARGGSHTWDNVALAHRSCNISRGAKLLAA